LIAVCEEYLDPGLCESYSAATGVGRRALVVMKRF
jgi:hypothetical protein